MTEIDAMFALGIIGSNLPTKVQFYPEIVLLHLTK